MSLHYPTVQPFHLEYLSRELQNRHAFRDFSLALRPKRQVLTLSTLATYYFRSKSLLGPVDRWTTSLDTEVGGARFNLLCEHFGAAFAAQFHQRRTMTRDAFTLWVTEFIEPHDQDILNRLKLQSDVRSAESDAAELQEMRQMTRHVEREGFLRRRRDFASYLRRRKGVCNPRSMYKDWRGVEPAHMKWARPDGVFATDPDQPPSLHYRIKPDIKRVLGPAAIDLIFKAPNIDREELATKIEELP